jgi:hypothetical protein
MTMDSGDADGDAASDGEGTALGAGATDATDDPDPADEHPASMRPAATIAIAIAFGCLVRMWIALPT